MPLLTSRWCESDRVSSALKDIILEDWDFHNPGRPLAVVTAAVLQDEILWTLPRPARHAHIIRLCPAYVRQDQQGFLLSDRTFATRERAREIAVAQKQIIVEVSIHAERLFSEDLW